MQEQLKHINQQSAGHDSMLIMAIVMHAQQGEATSLTSPDGTQHYTVIAHSAEVSFLNEGDQVLALLSVDGAIVTHRLRRPGDKPQQGFSVRADGALEINNAKGISIRANNSHISIDKTGRIFVDGKEIYSFAIGVNRLQGATIELN
jgi:hypothetical protein